MNKTLNINLAGFIFHVDEDAFMRLEQYLNKLKAQFASTEGGEEIIQDIESRIAELFKERLGEKQVVALTDVEAVIGIMGQPEDFVDADDEQEQQHKKADFDKQTFYAGTSRTIYRDTENRIIGGVAAGLGHYFNINSIWLRLLFVALFFSGFGTLVYIVLWIVVPKAITTAEKLEMRGERVNISNIEKSIREEFNAVGGKISDFTMQANAHDYSRYKKSAGGFFSDLGKFIGSAVRLFIKVIGKVLGFLLILFAFGILIILLIAILTGGFHLLGSNVGLEELLGLLELVSLNTLHYNSIIVGVILVTVAPLFLFVYLGLRLLLNLEPLHPSARSGAFLSIIIGAIILAVSGIRIGISLDEDGGFTQRTALPMLEDSITVDIVDNDIYQKFKEENFEPKWMELNEQNIFRDVELNILKSTDSFNYLVIERKAQGHNKREASLQAEKISFNYEQTNNALKFENYYTLGEGIKYKGQRVRYQLYLKPGQKIFLDRNTIDLIYDVPNVQDMHDFYMVNHWWEMTNEGLNCMDCEERETPKHNDRLQNLSTTNDTLKTI